MELLVGLMEENIEGIGKMEDKMEKGSFIILKIKNGKKEYGKKEKEQNGLIDIKIFFIKLIFLFIFYFIYQLNYLSINLRLI